jgi:phosphoheptose isomerase
MKNFYPEYFQQYKDLAFNEYIYQTIESFISEALNVKLKDSKIIFVGNGASAAKDLGLKVITFTGRDKDHSLKLIGDINFWVDSHAYNVVECIHMIWLTTAIDRILGNAIYEVSSLD